MVVSILLFFTLLKTRFKELVLGKGRLKHLIFHLGLMSFEVNGIHAVCC